MVGQIQTSIPSHSGVPSGAGNIQGASYGVQEFTCLCPRMIDTILRSFRSFCRVYVDDIVLFSTTLLWQSIPSTYTKFLVRSID